MNLIIKNSNNEIVEPITKENKILVINKREYFNFYNYFYDLLKNKNKNIEIRLGEKIIDTKNTFAFSFQDFTEILEHLSYKKGTLFYEYISGMLVESEMLDNDTLLYNLVDIVKNILSKTELNIDYDVEDNIEKILLNAVDFTLNYDLKYIDTILNLLLEKFVEKNISKTIIIFYDSSICTLNTKNYENCYTFDSNYQKDIKNYNLIVLDEIHKFDTTLTMEKLESFWPVEFNRNRVEESINNYFALVSLNMKLLAYDETELITYHLLNKIYYLDRIIINKVHNLRENVIKFLEQT